MLLILLRLLFGACSLMILGGAGYLLWDWYEGEATVFADGTVETLREDWKLWTAVALLVWSILGRFIVLPLLAREDRDRPGRPGENEWMELGRAAGEILRTGDKAKIYLEECGPKDAPALLLVHGWGLDSTIWDYARRDLGDDFRIFRFDLRGLGKSRTGGAAVGLSELAADLKEVVTRVGGRPIVIGHSIGGMAIQTLARDDRAFVADTFGGAVLLNTTYTDPSKTAAVSWLLKLLRWPLIEPSLWLTRWLWPLAWLSAWQSYLSGSAHLANRLGFGRDVSRGQLEAVTIMQARNSPAIQARGNLAMMRWDASGALPVFPVPSLVIGGGSDIVTTAAASRYMAATMLNARLEIIEGVGHMGFLERADIYNDAIADFARAVRKKRTAQGDASDLFATDEASLAEDEAPRRARARLKQAWPPPANDR